MAPCGRPSSPLGNTILLFQWHCPCGRPFPSVTRNHSCSVNRIAPCGRLSLSITMRLLFLCEQYCPKIFRAPVSFASFVYRYISSLPSFSHLTTTLSDLYLLFSHSSFTLWQQRQHKCIDKVSGQITSKKLGGDAFHLCTT